LKSCLVASDRTRFLIAGYDRVVPATHMDQAMCDELPPPWRNPAPEKRWCRRSVRVTDHRSVARGIPASKPQLAHPADDPDTTQAVTAGLHPDSLVHAQTPLLADLPSPNHSDETAFHIERLFRLQHVVARPSQLVRQRLGRHDPVRSGFLAVEESPRFLVETACKVMLLVMPPCSTKSQLRESRGDRGGKD
jgi:hypothetical protein